MAEDKKFEIEVLTRLTKIETMLQDFKGVETNQQKLIIWRLVINND